MTNANTTTLYTRKVVPGKIELLRGDEVLGSVQAVTTSGRFTGQWIIAIGADGSNCLWGKRYPSAQLAMNALVRRVRQDARVD